MRREYVYSGTISLLWFLGTLLFLWIVGMESFVGLISLLLLSLMLFATGLVLPEKKH